MAKSLPFIVIVIAHVRPRQEPARAGHHRRRAAALRADAAATSRPWPSSRVAVSRARACSASGSTGGRRSSTRLVFAVIALSLVVLTGFVGQISLAQGAIAGHGRLRAVEVLQRLAFPAGADRGRPRRRAVRSGHRRPRAAGARRQPGRRDARRRGGHRGAGLQEPEAGGIDRSRSRCRHPRSAARTSGPTTPGSGCSASATDDIPPNVWFGVLCLIFVVILALVVVNVRRSGTGRRFLTVRANERAAAAAGVGVPATKMVGFALSAFIAGFGGVALRLPLRLRHAALLRCPQLAVVPGLRLPRRHLQRAGRACSPAPWLRTG